MREPIFEFIEQTFEPSESNFLQTNSQNTSPSGTTSPPFQFNTFFDSVIEEELCPHPDNEGWYCVPIHDEENPLLTGEYVVFVDHQLRGQRVLLADPKNGDQYTSYSPDEFSDLTLVNHLRFWASSYHGTGVEQARSFAIKTIAKTDRSEVKETLDEDLDQLNAALQGLEYAVAVGRDLPSVERATLESLQETLRERIDELRTTKQQTQLQTAVEEIQDCLDRGDEKLDALDFEGALSAYMEGEKRLDQVRHTLTDSVQVDEQLDIISQKLSGRIQTAKIEQQQAAVDDLQTTAAEIEQRARETEENGDYLQARALYRESNQTYKQARDAATRLPTRRKEINKALDRVTDRIEAAESEYYQTEISAALEEASRHERLGDELSEMDSYEDAWDEYGQALTHANRAVDFADEGGVLHDQAASCKTKLERKHTAEKSKRDRKRIEHLVDQATTLEEDVAETADQTISIDTLEEIRELLIEARNLARTTDGVDPTPIERRFGDITSRYRRRRNEQNEQAIEGETAAAEEQLEAGEQSLEAGEPLAALQSFRSVKQEYVVLRESLTERGLDEFDNRFKARLSQLETKLRTARQECQTRVNTILDSAEKLVEEAKSYRESGDYEAAQSKLGDALQEYQEAYQIASELQSDQLQDIRSRFRYAESEIQSLQAVPAKVEIQHCIEDARRNVQAAHTAQSQGQQVNARELYNDAQYLVEVAIDIVNEYDLGTTVDIERHNLRILRRNKQKIEACRREVDQAIGDAGLSRRPEIENVTENLRPPNTSAAEIEAIDDTEKEPYKSEPPEDTDEATEAAGLDIYEEIKSELEGLSDL